MSQIYEKSQNLQEKSHVYEKNKFTRKQISFMRKVKFRRKNLQLYEEKSHNVMRKKSQIYKKNIKFVRSI